MRATLLIHDTNLSVEPLVTPDQANRTVKDKNTMIRKVLVAAQQRPKPVANAPADNSIADLSTELQATTGNLAMPAGVATVNSSVATVDTPPVIAASKRQRLELRQLRRHFYLVLHQLNVKVAFMSIYSTSM